MGDSKKTVLIKKKPTIMVPEIPKPEKVNVEVQKPKKTNVDTLEVQKLARAERRAIYALFKRTFPVFWEKKLLKIGIHLDRYKRLPEYSHQKIAQVIRWQTSDRTYLKNILSGAVRFNLEGDPVGTITDTEKADARKRLSPQK